MQDVIAYIDANRKRFVDDLIEWVRIPSVSSDPKHTGRTWRKNADHLAGVLRGLGAGRVEVWRTPGHPAVFAEWMRATGKLHACSSTGTTTCSQWTR